MKAFLFILLFLQCHVCFSAPGDTTTAFSILGIEETATPEEAESSYRKLAFKYNPDLITTSRQDGELFGLMNTARDLMKNPSQLAIYKRFLKLSRAGEVSFVAWDKMSALTVTGWESLDALLSKVEMQTPEADAKVSDVSDVIKLRDVVTGSPIMRQMMNSLYSNLQNLKSFKAAHNYFEKTPFSNLDVKKAMNLSANLASEAISFTRSIKMEFNGKPLKFEDEVARNLFIADLRFSICSAAYSDTFPYHKDVDLSYFNKITQSSDMQTGVFLQILRSNSGAKQQYGIGNSWIPYYGYFDTSSKFGRLTYNSPNYWAAAASKLKFYILSRAQGSDTRTKLANWFGDAAIVLMAKAAADHRNSGTMLCSFALRGGFPIIDMIRSKVKGTW